MISYDEKRLSAELNPQQLEAVLYKNAPSLILAGAGSGKTRAITFKMAHFISVDRIPSDRILAVTFTNKAAKEMKLRLHSLLGIQVPLPWMGTFHSICVRILRRILPKPDPMRPIPGHFANFSIFDDEDQKKLFTQMIKNRGQQWADLDVRLVRSRISSWKNQSITVSEAQEKAYYPEDEEIASIYALYQQYLHSNNAFDFDDLLSETVKRLKASSAVREDLAQFFQAYFVDEYQDTNPVQFELIRLLTNSQTPNITVVGDDDQSIYAWRGADLKIIRNFHSHFKQVQIFKLEQNYRSTSNIVRGAGAVIANNAREKHYEKQVFSKREGGEFIVLFKVNDERMEAEKIAQTLRGFGEEAYPKSAILYRTNAQSRVLEEALHRLRIPCRIVGGISFYQRKEIKDVFAYLKLMLNPYDSVSLRRVINVPRRGIGETTINQLVDFATEKGMSLFQALSYGEEFLTKAAAKKILGFLDLLESMRYTPEQLLPTYVERVLEMSGLWEMYEKDPKHQDEDKLANLGELINSLVELENAQPGVGLEEYLQQMALETSADTTKEDPNAVQLMTLHSAKGLEFKNVFIAGCSERLFPSARGEKDDEIEEERRLMYVGMTRAENKLYLSHAQYRKLYGRDEYYFPSRFLKEIDPEVIQELDVTENYGAGRFDQWESNRFAFEQRRGQSPSRGFKPSSPSPKANVESSFDEFNQDEQYLDYGSKVFHAKFGPGKVLSLEGEGENSKITVRFDSGAVKKLILKYANLKVVSS